MKISRIIVGVFAIIALSAVGYATAQKDNTEAADSCCVTASSCCTTSASCCE